MEAPKDPDTEGGIEEDQRGADTLQESAASHVCVVRVCSVIRGVGAQPAECNQWVGL